MRDVSDIERETKMLFSRCNNLCLVSHIARSLLN